jgi:hypothetical protein
MNFYAYCPHCEQRIGNATTVLGGADLDRALENDGDIEVVHMTIGNNEEDHRWRLNREEKERLKGWRAGKIV